MNISASPGPAVIVAVPSELKGFREAANSSVLTVVVPTATTRLILSQRPIDLRGRSLGDRIALAMEFVVLYPLRVHRLKRPQAHMQSQFGYLNSSLAYFGQDLRRKVQACCGRGHAAGGFRAGIDRLVAFAVFLPVVASDIWWQRDVSQLLHDSKKIRHGIKAEGAFSEFPSGNHFSGQFRGCRSRRRRVVSGSHLDGIRRRKENLFSYPDLPARTHQRLPLQRTQLAGKHDFNAAMKKIARSWISGAELLSVKAGAASVKAGGKDAAAVEDQQVSETEQFGKVSKFPIFKPAGETRKMQ